MHFYTQSVESKVAHYNGRLNETMRGQFIGNNPATLCVKTCLKNPSFLYVVKASFYTLWNVGVACNGYFFRPNKVFFCWLFNVQKLQRGGHFWQHKGRRIAKMILYT
jgi:hypothetical protein